MSTFPYVLFKNIINKLFIYKYRFLYINSSIYIIPGDVSFGGNIPQFLYLPNYPLYLSKSFWHDIQDHPVLAININKR
jgi:hypothetical protein